MTERIVPRPRLFALLDDGARGAVTVVRAGPGWGKTALVRSWVNNAARKAAWLNVRPEHRDGRSLTLAVAAALEPAGVLIVDGCAEGAEQTVTLVLDDFQVLDGAPANADLAAFIDRRLNWLRFVLITRSEPGLPLHRLRATGELTEIGPPELAFTADEDDLGDTEGWALGIKIGREAPRPAEAVRDYLLREVLDAQPPAVRRFLLRTCFPDLICPELAAALTGETRGRQILEHLCRTTGFVSAGPQEPWFRYHRQLRGALRHQFDLEDPDATPALHGLIARWYARRRMMPEALRHARAAGDWAYLGRFVAEQAIVMLLSEGRHELVATIRQIPAELLTTTAELSLCSAVLMFASGNQPALRDHLARARRQLAGRDPDRRVAVDAAIDLFEAAAVVRVAGDMPRLYAATTTNLEALRSARLDEVPALLELRAFALSNKGVSLLWTGRLDQADQYLWAGMAAARSAATPLVEINAQAYLGLVAYLQGSLAEAEEHAEAAGELAGRLASESAPQAAMAHLVIALIELERDRSPEAQSALRRALHSEMTPPEAVTTAVAGLVRVQLLLAADDPGSARALLTSTRAEAPPPEQVPRLDRWLRLTEAEVALALKEPDRVVASYHADQNMTPPEQVCLGRAYAALGDHTAAEELLARAAHSPDMVAAVTAWLGLALLAEAQGHVGRSVDAMSRAGALARRSGIRRPFRRFDPARMEALAGRQRWLEQDGTFTEAGPAPAAIAEPLSERERDVLRFLPTVLTAGEIAGSLSISVNTVKAHMRAIYRKLGAARRREAVVRARQLGLL